MPIYNKESYEYRLLVKVSTLLLKAKRESIPHTEMVQKATFFKVNGEGLVNDLIDNGFCTEKNGTLFFNKNKGGENMKNLTPQNKTKIKGWTSGETKIAKAILEFYPDINNTPVNIFEQDLEENFCKGVFQRVEPHLAVKVLERGNLIKVKKGIIYKGD